MRLAEGFAEGLLEDFAKALWKALKADAATPLEGAYEYAGGNLQRKETTMKDKTYGHSYPGEFRTGVYYVKSHPKSIKR